MCLTGGSLIGVPGAGFSLLSEPAGELSGLSEEGVPEEDSLGDELSEDAGAGAVFEAALVGLLGALAGDAGSLAAGLAEFVGALVGVAARATSAAIARCASMAASAGEPEG